MIGVCRVVYYLFTIVIKKCAVHFQGFRNMCSGKFGKCLTRYPCHNLCKKCKTGIAIHELISRVEIQILLSAYKSEYLLFCDYIIQTPAGHSKQIPLIP